MFDPAVPRQATTFATDANRIIDLDVGPDGNLYGLSPRRRRHDGADRQDQLRRLRPEPRPEAVACANKTSGPTAADGQLQRRPAAPTRTATALTYSWNFGDGTTATGKNVTNTYTTKGTYTAVLTVTDGRGGSDTSEPIVITPGQRGAGHHVHLAGDQLALRGQPDDHLRRRRPPTPRTARSPASKFDWTIVLHHQTHEHPFLDDIDGVDSGSFTIPVDVEVDPVQFYRIHLRVTDSAGVATTVVRRHQAAARARSRSPATSPAPRSTSTASPRPPARRRSASSARGGGSRRRQFQTVNGTTYEFVGWSDYGAPLARHLHARRQTRPTPRRYKVATTALATRRAAADAYVRDGAFAGAELRQRRPSWS